MSITVRHTSVTPAVTDIRHYVHRRILTEEPKGCPLKLHDWAAELSITFTKNFGKPVF